uniref:Uncharacterized protein n=1 Tax=Amphilophus citrinellus TaxID=61819 RepID=A0A3Q0SYA1_AMPCI
FCLCGHRHVHSLNFRNLTYFSFFSELHHSDHVATTIIETMAISTVFLVSVAANVGAVVLVTCEHTLLFNKTILTLNLFYVGLCLGMAVAITTLASISVERVQAILWLQTVPTLTPRMVTVTLIFICAFSALTSLPLSRFFTLIEVDGRFTGLLSGLIILVSYSKMLQMGLMLVIIVQQHFIPFQIARNSSAIFIITFLILVRNSQGHIYVSSTMFFWVVTFTLANSANLLHSRWLYRETCFWFWLVVLFEV